MPLKLTFRFLLGPLLCVGVAAADEPVTVVQVVHPVSMGFTTSTAVENDELRVWLTEGYPIVFARNLRTTLNWTISTSSDAQNAYMNMNAPSAGEFGSKTCCEFDCTQVPQGLSVSGYCTRPSGGCELCVLECADEWVECPAGTTEQKVFGP